ncbi:unnamed protein product [Prorocentrum cordatum]|nr:unnamed protein product [Polarella glacialis]
MLAASEQWSREDPAQSDERAGFALATQQHFDSELRKRLVCETCGDHRDVHERFRDFSLDFDKSQSDSPLQLMLKSYFEQESLEAKCERCGCGRARMEKSLTSAPRVLVLHLKRFVPNPSLQRYEKQHGSVRIPSVLDLSQCVGCLGGGASAAASPAASPQRPPARPLAAEARSTPVAPLAPTAAGSVPGAETPPPRGGAGAGAGAGPRGRAAPRQLWPSGAGPRAPPMPLPFPRSGLSWTSLEALVARAGFSSRFWSGRTSGEVNGVAVWVPFGSPSRICLRRAGLGREQIAPERFGTLPECFRDAPERLRRPIRPGDPLALGDPHSILIRTWPRHVFV